ncbi:hypothetical protein ES703_78400 [subsurface metagenome]
MQTGYKRVKNNELWPKIGLLPAGHFRYWPQFPKLKSMGLKMYERLLEMLKRYAKVVAPDLVDTAEKSAKAGELFKKSDIDMLLIFPLGYTTSMMIVPAIHDLDVPIRILNAHEDRSYDYAKADTTIYLYHEGVCCIPEYSGALVNLGKKFKVRTGYFDEHRLLKATGKMLVQPEVEEIKNAFNRVADEQLQDMYPQFFFIDFDEDFMLMGHDGPSNINMARGKPRLQHLEVHHGKTGHGLGIDFDMKNGPVTLLNLTQFDAGETFKLVYSVGEIIPGPILRIGNPNCRVRLQRPIHEFMDAWCRQGPSHHIAIGYGDLSGELEIFSEAMKFRLVRV